MIEKGYVIGFSSGMFMTASQEEREQFLTMPRKFFKGALEGVTFTQVDIESINEFKEPFLKEGINRMKSLGLRLGFHGESYAMGGAEKPIGMLDSCIESDYVHAHDRLIEHIEGCGSLGGEYVNIHPSETTPFIKLGLQLQPAKLVDPWGRPFKDFFKENPKMLDWAISAVDKGIITATHLSGYRRGYREEVADERRSKNKEFTEEEKRQILKEGDERALSAFVDSSELEYGPERIAYIIISKWMQENKDQLWRDIVGKYIPDDKLNDKNKEWVPAVAAKYIWGHFNPKSNKDPKPLLQKYELYFAFETQMGSAGLEGLQRLSRPRDMVFMCKAIGSPYVTVCFDFEHVLSQNMNPREEIESIPSGLASYIKVCHLGWPTPHVPAHMPIPLGSEAQLYLYELLFELRKKGMDRGFFIFERAGEARGSTILALRMIKQFLEKDVPPKELPLSFYGMEEKGPDIRRQEVSMREHFLDPLKGMLVVPEEEYTFLSKAATEKGKAEVWKKEQFR
jgi:sugar phosphate isomerase/epimerase